MSGVTLLLIIWLVLYLAVSIGDDDDHTHWGGGRFA